MGIIDSFFSLNIQKLFISGRVDKAYERMYAVAERLAIHEMQQRTGKILNSGKKKFDIENDPWAYPEEMAKFKAQRIKHHIEEMKSLLTLREEVLKEQAKPKS